MSNAEELNSIFEEIERKKYLINNMADKGCPYDEIMKVDKGLQELIVKYTVLTLGE